MAKNRDSHESVEREEQSDQLKSRPSGLRPRGCRELSAAQCQRLIATLMPLVQKLESDPQAQKAILGDPSAASVTHEAYVAGLWEEGLRSPDPMDEKRLRGILAHVTQRLGALNDHARDYDSLIDNFIAHCEQSPECPHYVQVESRSAVRQRTHRTINGMYDFVMAELPRQLRRSRATRYEIRWEYGEGKGRWSQAGAEGVSIRDLAIRSATLLGELDGPDTEKLAACILADLKTGLLVLPHFRIADESTPERLVLDWIAPELHDESDFTDPVVAASFETEILQRHPQLSALLDRAICLAAVADTINPAGQARLQVRDALEEAAGLSREESNMLVRLVED